LILHIIIAGLMILSGSEKIIGLIPPEALSKYGLDQQMRLIGEGAILASALLMIPRTSSLGILMTSLGTARHAMAEPEPAVA
jgi:hypothetical protein